MAVTFLGYIDNPEEMLSEKRRCLFLYDSDSDKSSLPTSEGLTLPNGSKTAKPAPGSFGIVIGGVTQAFKSTGAWADLNGGGD